MRPKPPDSKDSTDSKELREARLAALRANLPALAVETDPLVLADRGRDWTRLLPADPLAVAFPTSVEQVRELVSWANRELVPLVPSGGRTGLSGGAVAAAGELVVALDRLNRVLEFDEADRSVTVEAGAITETIIAFAAQRGLFLPVDFASRGSSQIGGNVATNAGGVRVIRYGMLRDWVSGLKVVTGAGEVLELNHGLIKNATGYDLRHLFLGSEGTLGFVVEVTLRLTRPPIAPTVLVLPAAGLDAVLSIFERFRSRIELQAFEMWNETAMGYVVRKGHTRPFDAPAPYYVLVEFELRDDAALETVSALVEECEAAGWCGPAVMSQSAAEAQRLWRLREEITEAISPWRPYKNDVSVRTSRLAPFLREMDELLTREYPGFDVVWFGHVGDGNLHIGILKPDEMSGEAFADECDRVSEALAACLERYRGSVSAEHGVGLFKKPFLGHSRSAAEIAAMRGIKRVFDPNGILNPGKIFDP
jgi:FAD/FMN-containing dehydrogenase